MNVRKVKFQPSILLEMIMSIITKLPSHIVGKWIRYAPTPSQSYTSRGGTDLNWSHREPHHNMQCSRHTADTILATRTLSMDGVTIALVRYSLYIHGQ